MIKEGECHKEHIAERSDQRNVWIEEKKLVTFIAAVTNATSEIKSKTERIQINVKAAVQHLDLIRF